MRNLIAALFLLLAAPALAQTAPGDEAGTLITVAVAAPADIRREALDALVKRGNPDALAALILALRYRGPDPELLDAISALAGAKIASWEEAMLWQEAHPQIVPHPVHRELKLQVLERIDPQFMRFLGGERSLPANLRIRLEEIEWGGVLVDGIPSLDNPKLVAAAEAGYLGADNLVFGIEIGGDARAYPLRIMGWHEMFNDVIGGVPVALAYCTLCGAGILFDTRVEGQPAPFVFGSSGFLYRSNKLMFDRQTDSLWNQFTGEPVSGPLARSGIRLKRLPVTITTWGDWKAAHPGTRVLSLDTGHDRNYGEGVVYSDYFASPDLMFPALVGDESSAKRKDFVFGLVEPGAAKAWPLSAFAGGKVINDRVGARDVVLIGEEATRTVRAYDRGGREFSAGNARGEVQGPGGAWQVGEDALAGPGGEKLERLAGHVAYWFAWSNYYGASAELYGR
jgi:hypothetical protein